CKPIIRAHGGGKGVDHRVAGDIDVVPHAFGGQRGGVARGGGKVQISQAAGEHAVHLLREGGVFVVGAQAGLHVAHPRLGVERAQRGGKGGGGVAVHQHDVRLAARDHLPHSLHHPGGDGREGLARFHDVEVVV